MACPNLANRWFIFDTNDNCLEFPVETMERWTAATLAGVLCVMLLGGTILLRGAAPKARPTIICLFLATFPITGILSHGIYFSRHADSDTTVALVLRWIAYMISCWLVFCALRECSFTFLDIVVLTGELRNEVLIKWFKKSFDIPFAIMFIQLPFTWVIIPLAVAHSDYQREVSVRIGAGLQALSIATMLILYSIFSWKLVQVMEKLLKLRLTTGDALTTLQSKIRLHKLGASLIGLACVFASTWFTVAAVWGCHFAVIDGLIWGFILGATAAALLLAGYTDHSKKSQKNGTKTKTPVAAVDEANSHTNQTQP